METNNQIQNNYNNNVVSVGNWVLTIILMGIPVVNLVLLLVWAFGDNTPVSKKNYAKAALILMAVGIILMILFWGTIAAILSGMSNY